MRLSLLSSFTFDTHHITSEQRFGLMMELSLGENVGQTGEPAPHELHHFVSWGR